MQLELAEVGNLLGEFCSGSWSICCRISSNDMRNKDWPGRIEDLLNRTARSHFPPVMDNPFDYYPLAKSVHVSLGLGLIMLCKPMKLGSCMWRVRWDLELTSSEMSPSQAQSETVTGHFSHLTIKSLQRWLFWADKPWSSVTHRVQKTVTNGIFCYDFSGQCIIYWSPEKKLWLLFKCVKQLADHPFCRWNTAVVWLL